MKVDKGVLPLFPAIFTPLSDLSHQFTQIFFALILQYSDLVTLYFQSFKAFDDLFFVFSQLFGKVFKAAAHFL